ncbi:peptidoglycan-binding protein [Streptomyces sp. NPDC057963]|uniref:peptidoglycan-binding protein n=1 Tax=Streptomyces sp. NPDC057963 TaxID=3346290 RepID=UPI0036EDBF2A
MNGRQREETSGADAPAGANPAEDGRAPGPRRKRRGRIAVLVATSSAVVTLGAVTLGLGGGSDGPRQPAALPPATAPVETVTLTQRDTVAGTLGYGEKKPLLSAAAGTVTWLPDPGRTVSPGEPVLRIDGRPVPLIDGDTPFYRELRKGVEGADVRQLKRNLANWGYTGFAVDDSYTAGTEQAVMRWQKKLGVPQTGTVGPGDTAVADGTVRVVENKAAPGQVLVPGTELLTYTATVRKIGVDLDADKQKLVKRGDTVTVVLPDGSRAQGTISSVGTVATKNAGGDGGQQDQDGGSGRSTVKVTVSVAKKDQAELGHYDGAPVDVEITAARKKGVLAVPVTALLALAEGGYGVEVVKGDTARTVAVETGMFADGKVEISGGIKAGDNVGIPK